MVVNEQPDCGDVVIKLFREGQGFSDQAGAALAEGTVETLDVIGLAAVFADMVQSFGVENGVISTPEIDIGFSIEVAVGQALP